jgi:tetratricopeptide (TPR) repeat protein
MATDGRSLIGREREWAGLMRVWGAASTAGARLVLISGEAGIGKTRLVEELAQWMTQRGHVTAMARSYAAEGALAYGPVIDWLRSDALRMGVARLDEAARSDLACLLPELLSGRPASESAAALSERERRQRIYDAVLRSVQFVERPLALIADDLQWCDRETLELVHYLVRRSVMPELPPLVVVGTVRREAVDAGHPLRDIVSGLMAIERVVELELGRLDPHETAALAEQLVGRPLVAHEASALYRQTEGNPLFVIETIRTGWSAPASGPPLVGEDLENRGTTVISPKVQAVIESRLRQLSPEAMMLARLGATIGREFTLDLLAKACGVDDTLLLQSLDELWRRRIIRARGIDAYDFSHDRIREVAYLDAGPLRRRESHLRVARALEELRSADPAAAGQLAWHYDRGGAPERAVTWYARAADAAQQVSAIDAVARLLRRALDLLQRLPDTRDRDEQELAVRLKLGAALVALRGYASVEVAGTYRRARTLCERLGHPVPPPILRALALVGIATADLDATESFGTQLVAAGEARGDDLVTVEGHYVLGVAAFWRGRLQASRDSFARAIARYHPERHREHVALYTQDPKVVCLSRLAWTLWLLGFPEDALKAREESIELAQELADPYSHAYALWFSIFIAIDADDLARVREQSSALERVAAEHGMDYIGAVVDSFVGYRETLDGEREQGLARMEAALSDPRAVGQDSVLRPQTLLLLARAHASGGDAHRGLDAVNEALAIAARGPHVWESELHRLRARLLIALGEDEPAISTAFAQALETARAHDAAWVEVSIALEVVRWRMRLGTAEQQAESRRTLARATERFGGSLELAGLQDAARLALA